MSLSFRSTLFRSTVMRTGLAAAVAILAAGGTLAGITAASASPASHPAAAATISHQLCYIATGGPYKIPKSVVLENQFSPGGFAPRIGDVAVHCNPVAKTLPTGKTFPIVNPNAHLLCYTITETAQPAPTVQITNQFGTAVLATSQPNLLCLPTWKSLTGPPGEKTAEPPGLSHFTCYPVTPVAGGGTYNPPAVMLKDEFAKAPVNANVSPVPQELCIPTEKIVGSRVYKIVNPDLSLLCFPVSPTPIITPVFDQDQFGTGTIQVEKTNWLCPPSTLQIG
jgi:hypothetical protein